MLENARVDEYSPFIPLSLLCLSRVLLGNPGRPEIHDLPASASCLSIIEVCYSRGAYFRLLLTSLPFRHSLIFNTMVKNTLIFSYSLGSLPRLELRCGHFDLVLLFAIRVNVQYSEKGKLCL